MQSQQNSVFREILYIPSHQGLLVLEGDPGSSVKPLASLALISKRGEVYSGRQLRDRFARSFSFTGEISSNRTRSLAAVVHESRCRQDLEEFAYAHTPLSSLLMSKHDNPPVLTFLEHTSCRRERFLDSLELVSA